MALSEVFSWRRTGAALEALEALLRCSGCGVVASEPRRYGRCAHVFCGPCADGSSTCAACSVPSEAREQRADTTLRAVAAGCAELRQLLGLASEQGTERRRPEREEEKENEGVTVTGHGQERRDAGPQRGDTKTDSGAQKTEALKDGGDGTGRKKDGAAPEILADVTAPSAKEKKAPVKGGKNKRNVEKVS